MLVVSPFFVYSPPVHCYHRLYLLPLRLLSFILALIGRSLTMFLFRKTILLHNGDATDETSTKMTFFVLFLLFFTMHSEEAEAATLLYTEEGGISQLKCPVQQIPAMQITYVRWTIKSQNDKFVAKLYEDGSQYCPDRRISIGNSSQTTLVINGAEDHDSGIYRCQVQYRELSPSVRYIKLTVYTPFELELEVSRSSDIEQYIAEESQLQINLTAGYSLTVNCTATMTRPPITLMWTLNGKGIRRDNYSRKTIENGNYFTTIISLTIDEAREEQSGLYSCVAYYGNTKESVKFRTFLLKVPESSGSWKNSGTEIFSSSRHHDNFTKRPGSTYDQSWSIYQVPITIVASGLLLVCVIIIAVVFWKRRQTTCSSKVKEKSLRMTHIRLQV